MSSPREVSADGNCCYRAVSLALFGTEDFHFYLRAVTAFHIIANRQLYDIRSESFVLEETCIRTPCLRNVISSALTDGDYAEMVHLFALSDALQIPIHSYCIPGTHSIPGVHPYTVRIEKNDFRCTATRPKDELAVMWTARMRPTAQTLPEPNHFTVLVPRSGATGIEEYAGTNQTHLDVAVRTNNDVEGWHGKLNRHANKGNINFYLLAQLLHEQALMVDFSVRLVSESKLKRCQRKKMQGRLFAVWDKYTAERLSSFKKSRCRRNVRFSCKKSRCRRKMMKFAKHLLRKCSHLVKVALQPGLTLMPHFTLACISYSLQGISALNTERI